MHHITEVDAPTGRADPHRWFLDRYRLFNVDDVRGLSHLPAWYLDKITVNDGRHIAEFLVDDHGSFRKDLLELLDVLTERFTRWGLYAWLITPNLQLPRASAPIDAVDDHLPHVVNAARHDVAPIYP